MLLMMIAQATLAADSGKFDETSKDAKEASEKGSTDDLKMSYTYYELVDAAEIEEFTGAVTSYDEKSWNAEWNWDDGATGDSTPPRVRMWVVVEDAAGNWIENEVVTTTSLSLDVRPSDTVVIIATANEDGSGALDSVGLSGESQDSCADPTGTYGQVATATWGGPYQSDPDPSDANLYSWMLVALDFSLPATGCPIGWSSTGSRASFSATAVNLAGLSSQTAPVYVTYTP